MKRFGWLTILAALALAIMGCEAADDLATYHQEFELELDPADINTGALVCAPLPSLETLLSEFDEWNDIKDHVEEVELKSMDYRVTENSTPVDGQITFYGGDDEGSVSTDPWGQTDTIEANTTYADYLPVDLTSLGRSEFQNYLNKRSISMVMCSDFSPDDDQIDLKVQLRLVVDVAFTAL